MKRIEDSLRDHWDNIKCTVIRVIGAPGEEEKKKLPQHGKGNSQSNRRSTESPLQDKPKEKYTKTHINQANRD